MRIKRDSFRRSRGGHSRILDVACAHCGQHLAFYQKDGPGVLKRMYADRFIDAQPTDEQLICVSCSRALGVRMIYETENRPAYRLYIGAVTKKIVSQNDI